VTLLGVPLLVAVSTVVPQEAPDAFLGDRMPHGAFERLPLTRLHVGGGEIAVGFAPGPLQLPRASLLAWVEGSARAVAAYYGRFPATHTRVLVVPRTGRGVSRGKAWGHGGAAVRITVDEPRPRCTRCHRAGHCR
jgi:hypothetical protein